MAPASGGPQRILALDFTKGVLVILMILYHWTNYFVGPQSELLRYLRFLTPSFIFITGFLISGIYLSKYEGNAHAVSRRLAYRGIKLLGLFVILNALIRVLFAYLHNQDVVDPFLVDNLSGVFVMGSGSIVGVGKVVSFFVLLPISYLLLLSAGLLSMQARFRDFKIIGYGACLGRFDHTAGVRHMFSGVWALSLLGILVLHLIDVENAHLELLSVGLLGIAIGYVSLQKIEDLSRYPYMVGVAYSFYVLAIAVWNVVFPLQIVGVCLSLLIIYLVGASNWRIGEVRDRIMLFGRYSLLAYVGQIAVIQLLARLLNQYDLGSAPMGLSLLGAFAVTALIVEVVDRARGRFAAIDSLYKAVFV